MRTRPADNWPRRWVYPVVSALIGLAATRLGFFWLSCLLVVIGWCVGRKQDSLRCSAGTDPMTGLANRREFGERLRYEVERALRQGTPLALLFIDVDKLKTINDRCGHHAGDATIQAVASCLRLVGRASDLPARFGGDELAVLASNTTAVEASALADRVRKTLRRISLHEHARVPPATVSIGIADLGGAGFSADALIVAADEALYEAKARGGDCAVVGPARTPFWSKSTITRGTLKQCRTSTP